MTEAQDFALCLNHGNTERQRESLMANTYYEFFAGGGMARAGLGSGWECVFANDIDIQKADSYRANWGDADFRLGDVGDVKSYELPGQADLAWASFPCQDLSLAGTYRGLNGARSGTFWPFWKLIKELGHEDRSPTTIVLENVYGALTSHGGSDFVSIANALAEQRYRFGAMIVDARLFVPQSRPRLFILALKDNAHLPSRLYGDGPTEPWHPEAVRKAYSRLSDEVKGRWLWWNPEQPVRRLAEFADVVEDEPTGVQWHTRQETQYLLSLMNELHRRKVQGARQKSKQEGRRIVGGIYRRTRNGQQRAEVRFDGLAGCLRTPAGGSSRQHIIVIDGDRIRTRLLSSREAGRLMGLPDWYVMPERYNQAYQLAGDGVVVPAVRHIAATLLEPIIAEARIEAPILEAAQ